MSSKFKHFFYFPIFFLLMYMGPRINILGVKFIIIWKVLLLIGLIYFILRKKSIRTNTFIKLGYLYCLNMFLSFGALEDFNNTFINFSKFLMIPLTAQLTLNYFEYKNILKYLNFIKVVSVYIILSGIPFLMGVLESNSEGYELDSYGYVGTAFAGFFQNAHSTSINFAISMLVVLYFLLREKKLRKRIFYFLLILLGLYMEYKTYVRTGYLIFILGFVILTFKNIKSKFFIFILIITSVVGLLFVYNNDSALQMRLNDENIYSQDSQKMRGSGRLLIFAAHLENMLDADIITIITGLGQENSTKMVGNKMGKDFVPHNGFIEALVYNGVIGFMIFVFWLRSGYLIVKKSKQFFLYSISFSIFFIYLIVMLVQGGNWFFLDIFFTMFIMMCFYLKDFDKKLNNTKLSLK